MSSSSSAGKRIMVVDDEKDIVMVISKVLERWKFKVDGFSSPFKALEAFRKEPDAFDLIITDVRMPGMSGPELVKEILAIRPQMSKIFISAFNLDHESFGAMPAEELKKDLLSKPVTMPQLCEAVKSKILK